MQSGRLRRLAEFGDVGAGDKGAAAAGQDDRLHFRIGDRGLDAIQNAAPYGGTQRIHRRTVDRDDGDDVIALEIDHFVHVTLPGYPVPVNFALRNLIPHLDTEGYFEAPALSTTSAQQQAMKRPGKKVATDRSFVVALSRGLDVLRAFHPNDGLLGNQEIAARTNLPKPTVSRLTYTLTKLGYLTPVPRFEKYQLAPSAMALGYAALANLGVRHLSEPFREEVMRETGGAVAVGGRDRTSMIYFGQSRGMTLGVQLDVGSRIPIATTAMGRAYLWALPDEERASLLRELREHYGSRWPRMREGIERAGEMVERYGFTVSAGEWQKDGQAGGGALKLNDGTGPYAFNCGAPAFRFTEDRLRRDIGPRLVAMVRNIAAALGGAAPQSKKDESKKLKAGGKVARVVEGIR